MAAITTIPLAKRKFPMYYDNITPPPQTDKWTTNQGRVGTDKIVFGFSDTANPIKDKWTLMVMDPRVPEYRETSELSANASSDDVKNAINAVYAGSVNSVYTSFMYEWALLLDNLTMVSAGKNCVIKDSAYSDYANTNNITIGHDWIKNMCRVFLGRPYEMNDSRGAISVLTDTQTKLETQDYTDLAGNVHTVITKSTTYERHRGDIYWMNWYIHKECNPARGIPFTFKREGNITTTNGIYNPATGNWDIHSSSSPYTEYDSYQFEDSMNPYYTVGQYPFQYETRTDWSDWVPTRIQTTSYMILPNGVPQASAYTVIEASNPTTWVFHQHGYISYYFPN